MSIDLCETLDDSQDALDEHYRKNCARQRRLEILLEQMHCKIKSNKASDAMMRRFFRLMQNALEFSSRLISEVFALQEERNLSLDYFQERLVLGFPIHWYW